MARPPKYSAPGSRPLPARAFWRAGAYWLPLLLSACAHTSTPATQAAGIAQRVEAPVVCEASGAPSFQRLTRDEYDATLRDLLGDDTRPARAFPRDENGLGFAVGATLSPLLAEHYMRAAEDAAARAVRERLPELLPCDPGHRDERCARRFVVEFGRRAYRRPLTETQVERLVVVFRAGAREGDFDSGVRLALETMLQSPYFLHRIELGDPAARASVHAEGEPLALSMAERAVRLSYFLWGSMPDDELWAAVDAGELATREQVMAQARRMLEDARAVAAFEAFAMQWLELTLADSEKDAALYPEWDPELALSMQESTGLFITDVVFRGEGTWAALMSAPRAFVDARLAPLYGLAPPSSTGWTRVTFDGQQRAGLLTQVGVLAQHARADQSSPVLRGRFLRERFFCQHVPPPPEDLVVAPPDITPDVSTRERYAQHASDDACSSCHELMDPIGFTLEHYDALGRFRSQDGGRPVDAAGLVRSGADEVSVEGAIELGAWLASSSAASDCFVTQMWTHALRRQPMPSDECSLSRVRAALTDSGGDIRAMMVALAGSDAFLHRPAFTGEGAR